MRNLLHVRFVLVSLFSVIAVTASAGDGSVSPASFNLAAFVKHSLKLVNGNSSKKAEVLLERMRNMDGSKICVCEIVELQNNNTELSNVAIFSEKSNNGDLSRGYKMAEKEIHREKKQMRAMFFDQVKVSNKIAVATDCLSLYMKLNQENTNVKMYDILNADLRSAVK